MSGYAREDLLGFIEVASRRDLSFLRVRESKREFAVERSAAKPQPVHTGAKEEKPAKEKNSIKSTLVGYFRPDANLALGAAIKKGDIVGIIEALGLPNEVLAESAGIVKEIFVGDGEPVEYGQPIALIGEKN